MRIGFDMDGVVADLNATFVDTARQAFPAADLAAGAPPKGDPFPVPEGDVAEEDLVSDDTASAEAAITSLRLTRRQLDRVWDVIADTLDFWESLGETEDGIVRRIAAVSDERRWEVLFVTSRPPTAGRTVQRQTQRWLERCGFPLPSVYVVHGSRGRIASALQLDVFVDDRPDNCLDIALESKTRPILIWRGHEQKAPPAAKRMGIAVEGSLGSCLDRIVEADRAAESPADFMQRLKRLFGLARPSSSNR